MKLIDVLRYFLCKMLKLVKKNGLQVLVDQHSDQTSFGTVFNDFNGFKVFIGEPSEFPVPRKKPSKSNLGWNTLLYCL